MVWKILQMAKSLEYMNEVEIWIDFLQYMTKFSTEIVHYALDNFEFQNYIIKMLQ